MTNPIQQMDKAWYEQWFGTSHYRMLYRDRNEAEAQAFLYRLLEFLQPPKGCSMLDLACGYGRHARYLASKGYNVVGLDLSVDNINYANQFANEHLSFQVHDMREKFPVTDLDYIFNFFTSFGYFETDEEHLQSLQHVSNSLKPNGYFVLDFLNSPLTIQQLIPQRTKIVDGITYEMESAYDNGYITKRISFKEGERVKEDEERVRTFTLVDFERLFEQVGLVIVDIFGDYHLQPYQEMTSSRLLMIVRKA